MLPYPSYLRVYEPAERGLPVDPASVEVEQQTVISRAVKSTTLTIDTGTLPRTVMCCVAMAVTMSARSTCP